VLKPSKGTKGWVDIHPTYAYVGRAELMPRNPSSTPEESSFKKPYLSEVFGLIR
jgi:hypothetical protein